MKNRILLVTCMGVVLTLPGMVLAAGLPPRVVNDYYNPGNVNGIPTAYDRSSGDPDIHDAINQLTGSGTTRNYQVDGLFVGGDDGTWSNQNGQMALVSLSAGYSNSLGYYTDLGVGTVRTELMNSLSGYGMQGSGTVADPYPGALLGLGANEPFGWYLDANGQTYYYSEDALNPGGWDHLMTYDLGALSFYADFGSGAELVSLNNAYVLAWEDLAWNGTSLGDDDFNDVIVVVGEVRPGTEVPEPATLLLVGAGALALGIVRRRS